VVDVRQWGQHVGWCTDELLEGANVEDVMDPGLQRQLESYRNVVDELDDLIGPEVARLELAGGGLGQGRGSPLAKTK
jgi:hypothetical protein